MSHRVRITREADDQISAIKNYIAEDSPVSARRWQMGLRERLRSLKDFPERHEIAFPAGQVGRDVRHTFFGTYRILYAIDGNSVIIVSVRHGARRPLSAEEVRRIEPLS
jgi:plasmid stabilization system protein ParE